MLLNPLDLHFNFTEEEAQEIFGMSLEDVNKGKHITGLKRYFFEIAKQISNINELKEERKGIGSKTMEEFLYDENEELHSLYNKQYDIEDHKPELQYHPIPNKKPTMGSIQAKGWVCFSILLAVIALLITFSVLHIVWAIVIFSIALLPAGLFSIYFWEDAIPTISSIPHYIKSLKQWKAHYEEIEEKNKKLYEEAQENLKNETAKWEHCLEEAIKAVENREKEIERIGAENKEKLDANTKQIDEARNEFNRLFSEMDRELQDEIGIYKDSDFYIELGGYAEVDDEATSENMWKAYNKYKKIEEDNREAREQEWLEYFWSPEGQAEYQMELQQRQAREAQEQSRRQREEQARMMKEQMYLQEQQTNAIKEQTRAAIRSQIYALEAAMSAKIQSGTLTAEYQREYHSLMTKLRRQLNEI